MQDLHNIKALQERIALFEDMDAYKTVYLHYFNGLQRFVTSFVKSKEVSEEIVSDVFIKIWQIRNRLMEIENLRVYLYTIARNFSLNYIQRSQKNPPKSFEELGFDPPLQWNSPEDQLISSEIRNRIQQAIHQLPNQCRIIFHLVKEDGRSYKEAADILQVSPLTIRNQLAIAVKKMAAALPDLSASSKLESKTKS